MGFPDVTSSQFQTPVSGLWDETVKKYPPQQEQSLWASSVREYSAPAQTDNFQQSGQSTGSSAPITLPDQVSLGGDPNSPARQRYLASLRTQNTQATASSEASNSDPLEPLAENKVTVPYRPGANNNTPKIYRPDYKPAKSDTSPRRIAEGMRVEEYAYVPEQKLRDSYPSDEAVAYKPNTDADKSNLKLAMEAYRPESMKNMTPAKPQATAPKTSPLAVRVPDAPSNPFGNANQTPANNNEEASMTFLEPERVEGISDETAANAMPKLVSENAPSSNTEFKVDDRRNINPRVRPNFRDNDKTSQRLHAPKVDSNGSIPMGTPIWLRPDGLLTDKQESRSANRTGNLSHKPRTSRITKKIAKTDAAVKKEAKRMKQVVKDNKALVTNRHHEAYVEPGTGRILAPTEANIW